jgi:hypothetical protein
MKDVLDPKAHPVTAAAWPRVTINMAISGVPNDVSSVPAEVTSAGYVSPTRIDLELVETGFWRAKSPIIAAFGADCDVTATTAATGGIGTHVAWSFVADAAFDFAASKRRPDAVLEAREWSQVLSYPSTATTV